MITFVTSFLLIITLARGFDKAISNTHKNLNPDLYLDTPQILRRHGYLAETHTVQTEDGYLIGVHRIPGSRMRKSSGRPVLLQHGLLGSSADFVINGPRSLAFALADEGYDVWLGNCRGNTYSRAHVSLPTSSAAFWNWSWHEAAIYDLPAVLSHISNITGRTGEIVYIGHSMGNTEFFVMSSTIPQAAKNVKLMIAMAPVAYIGRTWSRMLTQVVQYEDILQAINELLPHWRLFDVLAYACSFEILKSLCEDAYFAFWSWNKDTFNLDILPLAISHAPSGSSMKSLLHYLQVVQSGGCFRQYDYGIIENLNKYRSTTPPAYEIKNIEASIYLMYSDGDKMARTTDVEILIKDIRNLKGAYKLPNKYFDHIDFMWGKEAYSLVYQPLLDVLRNMTVYK